MTAETSVMVQVGDRASGIAATAIVRPPTQTSMRRLPSLSESQPLRTTVEIVATQLTPTTMSRPSSVDRPGNNCS